MRSFATHAGDSPGLACIAVPQQRVPGPAAATVQQRLRTSHVTAGQQLRQLAQLDSEWPGRHHTPSSHSRPNPTRRYSVFVRAFTWANAHVGTGVVIARGPEGPSFVAHGVARRASPGSRSPQCRAPKGRQSASPCARPEGSTEVSRAREGPESVPHSRQAPQGRHRARPTCQVRHFCRPYGAQSCGASSPGVLSPSARVARRRATPPPAIDYRPFGACPQSFFSTAARQKDLD